jgi:hypothetical protein
MVPFEHVQHQHAEHAFELVELFPPRRLDLLGHVVPIDRVPTAFGHEAGLLQ